jgi:hypothetical protein
MSKVFRRPMFRGGSTNMNGIMSGIEDRKNYATGSARERLERVASEFPDQGISPLNQFLIQGGLNLMSQPSTGSTLGDIATAAKAPTAQLFKDLSARGQLRKKLALEGEALDIEGERAEKLARIKASNKDFFAAQTDEAQFEVLTDLYSTSNIPQIKQGAANLADFRLKHKNQPYYELGYEYSKKSKKYEPDFGAVPIGGLTYDPGEGKAYRRNSDGSFTELNPITLEPLDVDGTE